MNALLHSTGNEWVDRILQGVVGIFSLAFPKQLLALYLTGSWSNGTGVYHPTDPYNSSDLDLHLVFRSPFSLEEKAQAQQWLRACWCLSPISLEAHFCSVEDLAGYWDTSLKQTSLLLYGEDVRDQITFPAIDDHIQRTMTFPPYAFAEPRRQPEPCLVFPLSYPDPDGEFYGYDYADPRFSSQPSTRSLVGSATWAATVILAIQAGVYVGNKRDAVVQYRAHINDDWSSLIEAVFETCKLTWQFRLPEAAEDRRQLRAICQEMLSLENHLLTFYKARLLDELGQEEEQRKVFALQMLSKVIFLDADIVALLQEFARSQNPRLQEAARSALHRWQAAQTAQPVELSVNV